jgi:hypothetical protein
MSQLTKAVQDILKLVRKEGGHPYWSKYSLTCDEVDHFNQLAVIVCAEADKQGWGDRLPKKSELAPALEDPLQPDLPPVQYESRLLLPGNWTYKQIDNGGPLPSSYPLIGDDEELPKCPEKVFLPYPPPAWFHALEELLALAERQAKRTGRPRKGETDKERLVIGALAAHHQCAGRSLGNPTPATIKQLANLASNKNVAVSVATVSRFFKRQFPGRGYKGYESACQRDEIYLKIALWQGEGQEHLADLVPRESGCREED